MLTELDTFLLARTYILMHQGDGINEDLCFGEQTRKTLVQQQMAEYRDGMWTVRASGGCGFVIDDRTGKVTGP